MKVAFVYLSGDASTVGGIQKIVHELCKRLIRDGHEPIVITAYNPKYKPAEFVFDFGGAEVYKIKIFKIVFGRTIYKFFGHLALLRILKILIKKKVDIIQLMDTWLYHGYIAKICKSNFKIISSIISTHADIGNEKERRMIGKYSDKIIASSYYNMQSFGLVPEKVSVIPLGHDTNLNKLKKDKEDVVLSVGRIDRRKNYETLIKAANIVVKNDKNIKFYIAGGYSDFPEYMKYLKNLIESYNLNNNVFFLGEKVGDELENLYAKSKIFYLPSRHEQFGIVFAEAMAHGLPVVSSNNTAIPEVVGNAGFLFDCEDFKSHANAIQQLFNDKKLLKTLSNNALKRAKLFTWERTYEAILKKYNEVI